MAQKTLMSVYVDDSCHKHRHSACASLVGNIAVSMRVLTTWPLLSTIRLFEESDAAVEVKMRLGINVLRGDWYG